MASQISHIIYAQRYFEKYPSNTIDKDQFILGCVFPDIRRIANNLGRNETHLYFSPVDLNFDGLTSFEAGWKFHLYCDMKREEILNTHKFYEKEDTKNFWQSNKMLEDEILYDRYNNWEKLSLYFNNPPKIELGLPISREDFDLWYAIVSRYIQQKPDNKSMHIFLSKQPIFKRADEIVAKIDVLRKDKESVDILSGLTDQIV